MKDRAPFSTGEAIALSSPSGRMSKRARKAAEQRLFVALFGDGECLKAKPPEQPSRQEYLLAQAKRLRELAARGMQVRKYTREAERLEQVEQEATQCNQPAR